MVSADDPGSPPEPETEPEEKVPEASPLPPLEKPEVKGGPQPQPALWLRRVLPASKREKVIAGIMLFLAVWLVLLFTAPYMLEPNTVDFGDGGPVTRNDFAAERDRLNMTGWVRFVYWEGDINHHLKANRSFFLNGNQMPEDTRDLGIYFGGILGLGLYYRRSYPLSFWAVVFGLAPMGMDGGIQLFGVYESANWLRVLTGFVSGVTLGLVVAQLGTDVSYSRALRRAWQMGRPYIHPPPPMPDRYFQAFVAFVAVSLLITTIRVVTHLN